MEGNVPLSLLFGISLRAKKKFLSRELGIITLHAVQELSKVILGSACHVKFPCTMS